jgi:phosphotransferase system IIB component
LAQAKNYLLSLGNGGNSQQLSYLITRLQTEMDDQVQSYFKADQKDKSQGKYESRTALKVILDIEYSIGGLNADVVQIVDQYDTSLENIQNLENTIKSRSKVQRFFWGGDKESAQKLEQELFANEEKITSLSNIINQSQASDDLKVVLGSSIKTLQREQDRLLQIVQEEKKSNGILGWIHPVK